MRRLILTILVLLFLAGGQMVMAIEKTKPSNNPAAHDQSAKPKPSPRQEQSRTRPSDSIDYDHFIDRNNNGIDDRAEPTRQKSPDRTQPEKPDTLKESPTPADSSVKSEN